MNSSTRRDFVLGSAVLAAGAAGRDGLGTAPSQTPVPMTRDRFDPWIEVEVGALRHNLRAVAHLAGGRPILAVAKNNAYGLGLAQVGPVFDAAPEVAGLAVVKAEEAFALRRAGVKKPILLMARCSEADAAEAVRQDIRLALFDDDAVAFCRSVARRAGRQVRAHLYLDTGMGRMGLPIARARNWAAAVAREVKIEGTFTELTEDRDYDREQTGRLTDFARWAGASGLSVGPLHAASSMAVMHQPETHLDLVRPGFALYGGHVSREAAERAELRPAVRLCARVVRVERLEAGEGVSYHRRWKATRPTWVAALPIGHVDGYPAGAVKGCEALIEGRLYRVIGTVSASHTVLELGDEPSVRVGDVAVLMGPDHPAVSPDTVAIRAEYSDYGIYFHLNPLLPRVLLPG